MLEKRDKHCLFKDNVQYWIIFPDRLIKFKFTLQIWILTNNIQEVNTLNYVLKKNKWSGWPFYFPEINQIKQTSKPALLSRTRQKKKETKTN